MHPVLMKTLGGLEKGYFFRQLFFGSLMGAFMLIMAPSLSFGNMTFAIISTLLYPYSRFVYESIVSFIVGNNVFFGNAILFLAVKLITIVMCWAMATLIAPVGLVYLYLRNSKVGS